MSKVHVFTLLYANPNIIESSLRSFWATTTAEEYSSLTIGDARYPVNRPAMLELVERMKRWELPGARFVDLDRNEGLHHNFNRLMATSGLEEDDLVVLFDSDEYLGCIGWIAAMTRVMVADPSCGWLSLSTEISDREMAERGFTEVVLDGVRVGKPSVPCINYVTMMRVAALRKLGGLQEQFAFYGGLESDMFPKFKAAGYWMGYLQDYRLINWALWRYHDWEYRVYKDKHARSESDPFTGSFEDWLARSLGGQ